MPHPISLYFISTVSYLYSIKFLDEGHFVSAIYFCPVIAINGRPQSPPPMAKYSVPCSIYLALSAPIGLVEKSDEPFPESVML